MQWKCCMITGNRSGSSEKAKTKNRQGDEGSRQKYWTLCTNMKTETMKEIILLIISTIAFMPMTVYLSH